MKAPEKEIIYTTVCNGCGMDITKPYELIHEVKEQKQVTCAFCGYRQFVPKPAEVKPPLGVIPEWFFVSKRIQDLTRAIGEYKDRDCSLTPLWSKELIKRIEELKKIKEDN